MTQKLDKRYSFNLHVYQHDRLRSFNNILKQVVNKSKTDFSFLCAFLCASNDQNQFTYQKAISTLGAVGLSHTNAKSLDDGSKVHRAVFVDLISDFNTIPSS